MSGPSIMPKPVKVWRTPFSLANFFAGNSFIIKLLAKMFRSAGEYLQPELRHPFPKPSRNLQNTEAAAYTYGL